MTDRPILMSAPMVRAVLREVDEPGSGKTQTRRLAWRLTTQAGRHCEAPTIWQSVRAGDRLWVRESFHATEGFTKPVQGECAHLFGYDVPGQDHEWVVPKIGRVREFARHLDGWGGRTSRNYPSIHMPRWASRLTLLVTATKMERLQEISEEDVPAEGIYQTHVQLAGGAGRVQETKMWTAGEGPESFTALGAFIEIWQSLHTKPGARWEDNPEVVALTFRPMLANIDQAEVG